MARPDLARLLTLQDFEAAASRILPKAAFEYFQGGADAQHTLRANLDAFSRRALLPRVLVDVSKRSLHTRLDGKELSFPAVVAPMAFQKLAHPQGEIALARAAARARTIYCASTLSTCTLEQIARAT